MAETTQKEWKILSVGNSFSVDTMHYLSEVGAALGYRLILGNLYVGGCSINKHYEHLTGDLPVYKYYVNDGSGWQETPNTRISEAVASTPWDVISIQHGTKDGSRYTDPASYERLPALIWEIRRYTQGDPQIAFNMTWVGEPHHHHKEIVSYGGDQLLIYRLITEITEQRISTLKEIDLVSATGTAIQNARTTPLKDRMSRDGYHLSYDVGRYIASLAFFRMIVQGNIDDICWAPEGVSNDDRRIAIRAVNAAAQTPYAVTDLSASAFTGKGATT